MKQFQIISWVFFFVGFFLRVFHLPGAAIALMIGTLLLLLHSVIYLIRNVRTKLPQSLLNLSFSLWTIYFLIRLLFLPIGPRLMGYPIFFLLCWGISIFTIVLHIYLNLKFNRKLILFSIYFALNVWLSYVQSYSLCYFLNLNSIIHQEHRKTDYQSWDKYSWFLYHRGKTHEALDANQQAQKAIGLVMRSSKTKETKFYYKEILRHEKQIKEGTWVY